MKSLNELKKFILHLRLNYNFFIISGAYLFGAVLSPQLNFFGFLLQFFNVHILLFGGATAYNSYWDKDKGPIGGLKNPPKMSVWMLYASWILQIVGLIIAVYSGKFFFISYLLSMFFFWIYSSPNTRWKGKPILSLIAIGISTGICAFFMGYFAYNGNILPLPIIVSSFGVTLLILSMFPASQAYQIKEDRKRKDITFVVKYGLRGVKNLYASLYSSGILLTALGLYLKIGLISLILLMFGFLIGLFNFYQILSLKGEKREYEKIMKIKYFSGSLFSIFLLVLIIIF